MNKKVIKETFNNIKDYPCRKLTKYFGKFKPKQQCCNIKHKVELFHNMNFTPDLPKLKLISNISESFFVFKNNFYELRITIKFILLHIQSTCGFFVHEGNE